MPPRLADYISHLLRLRVLQEIEWLADQARLRPEKYWHSPTRKCRCSPSTDEDSAPPGKVLSPASVIHPTSTHLADTLYNGVALFPSRPQRAALHQKLNELLMVERRARRRGDAKPQGESNKSSDHRTSEQKASHAYLLLSDSETILRADSVPLAIALWRVRLWEGAGWSATAARGWRIESSSRIAK